LMAPAYLNMARRWMVACALLPSFLGSAGAICNSSVEYNRSRRSCISKYRYNDVNSTGECASRCCALGPSQPPPMPFDGCEAWTLNSWRQCYICMADPVRRPDGPPASVPGTKENGCSARGPIRCATGVVSQPPPVPPPPAPARGPLGGEASVEYVNYARLMRWPSYPNGTGKLNRTTELSEQGWPLRDCCIHVFDLRPTHAWAPPIDDPERRQRDLSGNWTVRLVGNATVSISQGTGMVLGAASYDSASNTMSQPLVIAKGSYPAVSNRLVLCFLGTKQNATASSGTGFSHLEVLAPEDGAPKFSRGGTSTPSLAPTSSRPLFTTNFARALKLYDHLRWMGVTGTNSYSWRCGGDNAAGCSVIRWEDRQLPPYAFVDADWCPGCQGIPWEHVLLAANELDKDVWINVPITASAPTVCRTTPTTNGGDPRECLDKDPTATYEYQLAKLFRDGNEFTGGVGLKPNLNIYIEHSNEVWNYGFRQFGINSAMAHWEVLNGTARFPAGKSNLLATVPGRPELDVTCNATGGIKSLCWGQRLHARRTYEIAQTFAQVFGGPHVLNARIRMVYAGWSRDSMMQSYYNDTLSWLASQYGPVHGYLHAIAATQYFGPEGGDGEVQKHPFNYSTGTVSQAVAAFIEGADAMVTKTVEYKRLAQALGLKVASYEGGPGYAVGKEKPGSRGLNTMIEASRNPGMKDVVYHDIRNVAWAWGWDIYNYFAAVGPCSTYGCWGATEDWKDLDPGPPKLQALYNLTGTDPVTIAAWAGDPERPRAQELSWR